MRDPMNAVITWLEEPVKRSATGPLAGKRLLVKDLIDTAGIRTTYGSGLYADHVPSKDATVVTRALAAGASMVGKGHLPEFAWNVLGTSDWYGTCHNPVHPGRTTGGSSSGNAAALASDLCDLAIGTDTGCSIRLPAACCDVVGFKPAWGTGPLDGIFPLVPSLDTVGPMARTVADATTLWSVLSETAVPTPRLSGLTIGLLRQPPQVGDGRTTETSDAGEQWVSELEELGAKVVEATLPDASADTWPVFLHEAAISHASTFPSRADEYGAGMRSKLALAALVDPEAVTAGYRALLEWRNFVPEVDLYVSPCIGIGLPAEDVEEQEIRLPLSSFLRWVNLIGWAGLAIGNLQLVAPRNDVVLAAGLAWERR
jgi:Asp-tRNA(Asn)/Glu-tRNA(Gln) amidotransferase A subunit family amidase